MPRELPPSRPPPSKPRPAHLCEPDQESGDPGITVFLTTQYLDEAEQLADRIAILHEGTILASGTLVELQKRFPPAQVEYVEKQPTLEEIFLAIIGKKEAH